MPEDIDNIKEKTCSSCKETKSIENFYRNKFRRDGFTPQCKSCHDWSSQRKRPPTRDDQIGLKRCPRCQLWLAFDNFGADGKSSYCRDCQAAYQREQNPPSEAVKLKRRLLEQIEGDPADYKWCTLGHDYHLRENFNQNRARPDGLDTSCRQCRSEYHQSRKKV